VRRPARLLAAAWLACAAPGAAQDDVDEALEGFDDDETEAPAPVPEPEASEPAARSWWELTGDATLASSWVYAQDPPSEYRDLTRLQAQLALQLDLELPRDFEARIAGRAFRDYAYALEGRDHFTDQALENHQSELEFQELWLEGPLLDDLDLKFGRQIVAWGRSDNLRVLDVLNPIDSREPGLINVEDLKLPVTMTRLEYFRGSWSLELLAIHETRFDTGPVFGSDFFPPGVPELPEDRPANGGDDTEWGARLRGIFPGWDVSLHWARYWEDQPYLAAPELRLAHARVGLVGASGQVAAGDWLLKSEVALLHGLREPEFPASAPPRVRELSRIDSMAGVEYLGIDEVSIALEVVNRHLREFDSTLATDAATGEPTAVERNAWESSLLVTADFLHDRLHATLVAIGFGAHLEDGGLVRAELEYELRDALALAGGIVMYQKGERPPLDFWAHHDRLFLKIQYSF
jgi:hypothetical protein